MFSDRYEKASLIVTSNLPFAQWTSIFGDAALTAALLDRLTHHCSIHEFDWESIRFTESLHRQIKKSITPATTKPAVTYSNGSKPRREAKKRSG